MAVTNNLKGIKEKEVEYLNGKQKLNALFGMAVTRTISTEYKIDKNGEWYNEPLSVDKINEKLKEQVSFHDYSYFMPFRLHQQGEFYQEPMP